MVADDFVEPFRPFVDLLALKTCGDGTDKNADLTLDLQGFALAEAGPQIAHEQVDLFSGDEFAGQTPGGPGAMSASVVIPAKAASPRLFRLA